jgi:hypothetical protein
VHSARLNGTPTTSSDADAAPDSASDKIDLAKANLKDATLRPPNHDAAESSVEAEPPGMTLTVATTRDTG